jgi:hypothetical protein
MTLRKSRSLGFVAKEDAGYAMAVDQLGLACFFRKELISSDAAARIAGADSSATRMACRRTQ